MQKCFVFVLLLLVFLIAACAAQPARSVEPDGPTASVSQPEPAQPTSEPTQAIEHESSSEAGLENESDAFDCLGGEVSPIGQSIAKDYDFTNYDEVVTWFCNGAEFEDILVALETESQTDTSAEEMLQMLVDGFTWEEIWQFIGLTE